VMIPNMIASTPRRTSDHQFLVSASLMIPPLLAEVRW
jgi:hypothetical protein